MRFDLSSQNTKILQEQKKHRQWLIVFLGLSVTVVLGTAAALKLYGQALTHKVKVLDCRAEVHEHTEECYVYDEEKGEDVPVCGYADYLVHIHNDDCRDENGRLVCPLEEIKPHTHEDACYEERQVLICGLEGTGPVQGSHTDAAGSQPVKTPGEGNQPEQDSDAENQTTQGPAADVPADTEPELVCVNKEHTHTDACYEAELSCTQEEHQHENGCYEEALVCEAEKHQHGDSCKDEEGNLICDLEEHEHGDDCYERTLICGMEEHSHEESCYASRVLTCETEEHQHGDACYAQATGGTAAAPETKAPETKAAETTAATTAEETTAAAGTAGAGTHVHTAACYETKLVPVCGKLEKHVHDEDCYDKDGRLICEVPQLEEHVHNKDCFKTVELTDEEIAALNAGAKLHIHHEDCYDEDGELICGHYETHIHGPKCYNRDGELICGHDEAHVHDSDCYDRDGELICGLEVVVHEHDEDCYDENGKLICDHAHIHEESCFDEDGNMTCDFEDVGDYLWTCEEEDYIVTVKFNHEAKIPGNAKLIAEQITAEEDEEYFARREEEYREAMNDETADMRALLRVGFYVEDKEAKKDEDKLIEIESEAPVTVTVQFLDEDGLKEGDPITVVHFAKEGTELLDGGQAEDNSTTFEMDGFSDIAIGYGNEGAKATVSGNGIDESVSGNSVSGNSISGNGIEGETIRLDDSFEYEDEAFHITFHVKGEAVLPEDAENEKESEESVSSESTLFDEKVNESEKGKSEEESKAETEAESEPGENGETSGEEPSAETENTESNLKENLEFKVETLDEESDEYVSVANAYAEEDSSENELLLLQVLSYSLVYNDVKLDLSDCMVTADITPTQELVSYAENFSDVTTLELEDTDVDVPDMEIEEKVFMTALGVLGEEEGEIFDAVAVTETTGMFLTMAPQGTDGAVAFAVASRANPNFTVQYYANIKRMAETGKIELSVFDTSGKQLPTNQSAALNEGETDKKNPQKPVTQKFKPIYIDDNGNIQYIKKGDEKFKPTEMYKQRYYEYVKAPSLMYFNVLVENPNYQLSEIWVIYDDIGRILNCSNTGKGHVHVETCYEYPNGKFDSAQYKKYIDGLVSNGRVEKKTYSENIHFTNREDVAKKDGNYILIKENTVIRLVYDVTEKEKEFDTTFYDYDVSDGNIYSEANNDPNNIVERTISATKENPWYMYSQRQGINDLRNYADKKYTANGIKLAFGNSDSVTPTTLGNQKVAGTEYFINQANMEIFRRCSFGLVKKLENGKIVYADGVDAPKLFNEGDAIGKVQYPVNEKDVNRYPLIFDREGDTYTLTAVKGTNSKNLEQLRYKKAAWGSQFVMYSNEFWPMDNVPSAGQNGHDPLFGTKGEEETKKFFSIDPKVTLPAIGSDHGDSHNAFFGMTYAVEFDIGDDYIGPLEYYFFGDDDMWVFLDDTLVCDIGGVHQSVGEYVNLWDYLDENQKYTNHEHSAACYDKEKLVCKKDHLHSDECYEKTCGKHRLTFFYTERGASGSTCWMQFTLPTVTSLTPEQASGQATNSLKVGKNVIGTNAPAELQYEFSIHFTKGETNLADDYSYTKYDKDGNVLDYDVIIWNGGTFTLGEYILVNYLPVGTTYEVEETGIVYRKDEKTGNLVSVSKEELDKYEIIIDGEESDDGIKKDEISSTESTVNYINDYGYALPETGGPGPELYTMAGALCIMVGACLMYRKKFRGRRV